MSDQQGADRVGHGEASLGEAQSSNPPDDPEMIEPGAAPLDADVELDPPEEPEIEDGPDDPAPAAP